MRVNVTQLDKLGSVHEAKVALDLLDALAVSPEPDHIELNVRYAQRMFHAGVVVGGDALQTARLRGCINPHVRTLDSPFMAWVEMSMRSASKRTVVMRHGSRAVLVLYGARVVELQLERNTAGLDRYDVTLSFDDQVLRVLPGAS